MKYYYSLDGTDVCGPCSENELLAQVRTGALLADTLVCLEGQQEWNTIRFVFPHELSSQQNSRQAEQHAIGPYATATMQKDEQPVFRTTVHKAIYGLYIAQGAVVPLFALAVGFALTGPDVFHSVVLWIMFGLFVLCIAATAIAAAIICRTSELLITNRRVLIKVGLFTRRTSEMFINKIESISVQQGMFGRLWDFGTVTIHGTGGSVEPFAMIARPIVFRNHVQEIQSSTLV